jgi:tRNA nucleotidyltransferase/poly(A) polymerase/ribosomal protein S18 acetylase RimI-like enzyme
MGKIENFIGFMRKKPFIVSLINDLNGEVFAVGGVPRDLILNKSNKDIDLVVRNVPIETLINTLKKYGKVDLVGKSYGVLKFIDSSDGLDYDVTLPRTEKPTGAGGYRGFEVQSDEHLEIVDDLSRRDSKINAMAININTGKFIDPLGGLDDIEKKQISMANSEAYSDDPLRMLRTIMFASRFGFTIEPETLEQIKKNAYRVKEISPERILTEFDKIIKKGNILMGVELLVETGIFAHIFGKNIKPSKIESRDFPGVRTMGEFIFLMSYGVVENSAEFFKTNLKGDIDTYNEIKALELAFNVNLTNEDMPNVAARSIVHNMYLFSPNSLQSQIIPEQIEIAAKELLSGRYPKTVNELAINGNDMMKAGLKGKEIGDMQKSILIRIYADKVRNTKEDLLSLLPKSTITEELIPYDVDGMNYDDDDDSIDMDVAYDRAMEIAKDNNINILSNKELAAVTTNDNGEVIGAIFTSVTDKEYSFDVVIDKNYQRMGYGKELIGFGIEQYNYYKDVYGAKLKLKLDVVNPNMQALLKKYFNFRTTKKTGVDRANMTLKQDEGVADKYAEKAFGIPDTDRIADDKYNDTLRLSKAKTEEEPVGYVYHDEAYPIYMNPKSLDNFESNVRAISDTKGNLYVSLVDGNFVHDEMENALSLVDSGRIYDHQYMFTLLHRVGNSNAFGISDTSEIYSSSSMENKENTDYLLHLAEKMNPQYKFYNKYYEGINESVEKKNILNEEKKSKYKKAIDSLMSSKTISADMKQLIQKQMSSGSKYFVGGRVHGLIKPGVLREKSNKIDGVSMGADKNGFLCIYS